MLKTHDNLTKTVRFGRRKFMTSVIKTICK